MSSVDYAVVVPVYRGEESLPLLYQEIKAFFEGTNLSFELILVHDCGPDNSWAVMKKLAAQDARVRPFQLSRNFGQHNAIICGFAQVRSPWIITMDEDLQQRPADISALIAEQKKGNFDLVYGYFEERQHNGFRNLTSWLMQRSLSLAIPELHPHYSPFRLVRSDMAKACLQMNNSYTFLDGYLSWITQQVSSVRVSHQPRQAGESGYTLRKLLNHSINILITFSDLPIRLLSGISIIIFILSSVYSLYILLRKLILNDIIPGYSSLVIILGFGLSLILLGIGILGEYIHRINQRSSRRPNFWLRASENEEQDED